ncbi:MAG: serine/threonine-protein phosphatase [Odoribacter sp.]|nr:serine/threonine-protein phosphatase [Odoribacter sp.]
MITSEVFFEVGHFSKNKNNNSSCGDNFQNEREAGEGRIICVLSDGLGSGIKAEVLSSITTTMALNYIKANISIDHTAKAIINTLPQDKELGLSYSTFCIIDIDCFGKARVIEYETPSFLFFRNGKLLNIERKSFPIQQDSTEETFLYTSEFILEKEDRIICFSDGVTQSGMGSHELPAGWGEKVTEYAETLIGNSPFISAQDLAKKIVSQAEKNDGYNLKDDCSCCVIYCRTPRNLLICTGPPFDENNDKYLALKVREFQGKKVICGGTTSEILMREMGAGEETDNHNNISGVELITEGILTLGKIERLLGGKEVPSDSIEENARKVVKLLQESDKICFMVGTRINIAHQDPNFPTELEIRRNIVKKSGFY